MSRKEQTAIGKKKAPKKRGGGIFRISGDKSNELNEKVRPLLPAERSHKETKNSVREGQEDGLFGGWISHKQSPKKKREGICCSLRRGVNRQSTPHRNQDELRDARRGAFVHGILKHRGKTLGEKESGSFQEGKRRAAVMGRKKRNYQTKEDINQKTKIFMKGHHSRGEEKKVPGTLLGKGQKYKLGLGENLRT